jgi:uncharacterized membrane protein
MVEKSRSALIALSKMGAIAGAVPSMLSDSSIDDNGVEDDGMEEGDLFSVPNGSFDLT